MASISNAAATLARVKVHAADSPHQHRQTAQRGMSGRPRYQSRRTPTLPVAHELIAVPREIVNHSALIPNSHGSLRWRIFPLVRKWCSRFLVLCLGGIVDKPLPGPPALISVEWVVVGTLAVILKNATRWSRAKMAEKSGVSRSTVSRIWRAFGLKPHLEERLQTLERSSAHQEGLRHRPKTPPHPSPDTN